MVTILGCSKTELTPTPTADFFWNEISNGTIQFTNASKNADSYQWDFGDGKGKSIEKDPKYKYQKIGQYKVLLKLTGLGGNAQIEKLIDVKIGEPTAGFTFTNLKNGEVQFKNESKDASSFVWDFGDNLGKSTEKDPLYRYQKPGQYKVSLKSIGAGGETQIQNQVEVKAVKPTALFSFSLLTNGDVQFKNESKDANSYVWVIEGQNNVTLKDPKISFVYNGKYKVKLKAEGFGEFDETEQLISITNGKEPEPVSIPIIFHIVHFGESIGAGTNLTQNQVTTILKNLNDGFSNLYGSNNPKSVDTRVRFRLASYDINNNPLTEKGINRLNAKAYDTGATKGGVDIANDKELGPNESWKLKGDTFWNPKLYLNVWIFPAQYGESSAMLARVYESNPLNGLDNVLDNCICSPNNEFFQACGVNTNAALKGTTIIHEVGHSFGLMHVFSNDNCRTSDFCPDTYSYIFGNPSQACSDNLVSDKRDNFMDYGGAQNTFTYDQRERIYHVLKYGLWFKELKNSNR